jgi:hypothetical protein
VARPWPAAATLRESRTVALAIPATSVFRFWIHVHERLEIDAVDHDCDAGQLRSRDGVATVVRISRSCEAMQERVWST